MPKLIRAFRVCGEENRRGIITSICHSGLRLRRQHPAIAMIRRADERTVQSPVVVGISQSALPDRDC